MPDIEELRLRTGQLVTEDWYDLLVDYLEELGYGGVITTYGYVMKDLIPALDLCIKLGIPIRRFLEVHAGYGYFSSAVWVDGKAVLKDGDPITVEDLGSSAATKITTAVDNAKATGYVQPLHADLLAIIMKLQPVLSGYKVAYSAPDMGDVFASDLTALYAGRFRAKMEAQNNVYGYLKFTQVGQVTAITAALNAGAVIPTYAWHEFDFTCLVGDKLNVRITPATTLTIVVYNIPNA
jgi:hypothetical protein